MKSINRDIYEIKDNNENSKTLIIILLVLFILAAIFLSVCYVIDFCLKQNVIIDENMIHLRNIFLIISCFLSFIEALLILIIGFKNDEDYKKYKNYVLISKDELKEYKKEIKRLKNKK